MKGRGANACRGWGWGWGWAGEGAGRHAAAGPGGVDPRIGARRRRVARRVQVVHAAVGDCAGMQPSEGDGPGGHERTRSTQ
jgi:hypothetical protein